MVRRDYIMKLVQQLFDSLFLLFDDKNMDDDMRWKRLQDFYKDYLGNSREYFYNENGDVVISMLKEKYGDESLLRLEMLTEIMYADATINKESVTRERMLLQTLFFLSYLDENTNTYSLVRQGKIDEIKQTISTIQSVKE